MYDPNVGGLGTRFAVVGAIPFVVHVVGVPQQGAPAGVEVDGVVGDAHKADIEGVVGILAGGEDIGRPDGCFAEWDDGASAIMTEVVVGDEQKRNGIVFGRIGDIGDACVGAIVLAVDKPAVVQFVGAAVDGGEMELVEGEEFGCEFDIGMRLEQGGEVDRVAVGAGRVVVVVDI